MYYLISRYYDPNTGRFLSKDNVKADPINPITQNLYSYAGNNPVNYIDPDGHSFFSFIKKKASQFIGLVGNAVRTVEHAVSNVAANVSASVNNAVTSVMAGFSRAKVALVKAGNKAVRIVKHGRNIIKAKMRGVKDRIIKKFSNVRKSLNRVKSKAVNKLLNHLSKNRISLKGARKRTGFFNSAGKITRSFGNFNRKYAGPFSEGFANEYANNVTLSMFGILNKNINPNFDESKKPGSYQLGRMVASLYGMYTGLSEMGRGLSLIGGSGVLEVVTVGGSTPVSAVGVGAGATLTGLGAGTVGYSAYGFNKSTEDFFTKIKSSNNSSKSVNINKINDSYLKKKGIDAHELKKEHLGKKAKISEYDIFVDKSTGQLIIFKKGGKGKGIPTSEYIK